jgi:hypothetical protein
MADDPPCPVPGCNGKVEPSGDQHSTETIGRLGVRVEYWRSQTGRCDTCGTKVVDTDGWVVVAPRE